MRHKKIITFLMICTSCLFSCGSSISNNYKINIPSSLNKEESEKYVNSKNLYNIVTKSGIDALPSLGDQKILVVPVKFAESNCPSGDCITSKAKINTAFFGESSETGWESVSSFYEKSSYGNLHITGETTNWFTLGKTQRYYELRMQLGYSSESITNDISKEVANGLSPELLKQYDQNNDGYIDALWLVYNIAYQTTGKYKDLFWAYTYWNKDEQPNLATKVGVYAWGSYHFLMEGGKLYYNKPDAHTFIHETGHILGLDYYYNYDYSEISDKYNPLGGSDMMDANIGDNNPYSKAILGWINPKFITEIGEYKLNSFVETGEALFIGVGNNDFSPFNEYLIIERYTPTGLNQNDALYTYANGYEMPQKEGFRIYHVDARLGLFTTQSNYFGYWTWNGQSYTTNTMSEEVKGFYYFINSNSNSRDNGTNTNNKLISLIEAKEQKNLQQGYQTSDQTLFHIGDDIGINYYTDFIFNSGEKLKYKISIIQENNEPIVKIS